MKSGSGGSHARAGRDDQKLAMRPRRHRNGGKLRFRHDDIVACRMRAVPGRTAARTSTARALSLSFALIVTSLAGGPASRHSPPNMSHARLDVKRAAADRCSDPAEDHGPRGG